MALLLDESFPPASTGDLFLGLRVSPRSSNGADLLTKRFWVFLSVFHLDQPGSSVARFRSFIVLSSPSASSSPA